MSEEGWTHYIKSGRALRTACGLLADAQPHARADWKDVTCGSCRLEQPLAEPERAPEYRVPQHVLDTDKRLGLADELRRAEQDYTEAMQRAALAAREANAATAAAARIRTLLAEQEPAWRMPGAQGPGVAEGRSAGSERAMVWTGHYLSKPGPY
jgi:hypothetical protein